MSVGAALAVGAAVVAPSLLTSGDRAAPAPGPELVTAGQRAAMAVLASAIAGVPQVVVTRSANARFVEVMKTLKLTRGTSPAIGRAGFANVTADEGVAILSAFIAATEAGEAQGYDLDGTALGAALDTAKRNRFAAQQFIGQGGPLPTMPGAMDAVVALSVAMDAQGFNPVNPDEGSIGLLENIATIGPRTLLRLQEIGRGAASDLATAAGSRALGALGGIVFSTPGLVVIAAGLIYLKVRK